MSIRTTRLEEDYDALRNGVGAYHLGRDVLAVHGPEAATYLQGQVSQDLSPLGVGASVPALVLEPDGKLCALVRVTRTGPESFVLDTDAGFGAQVADRLRRFRLRTKAEVGPQSWPCVALRGSAVRPEAPAGNTGSGEPWALSVDWNGVRGVDRLGPGAADGLPPGARWCGDAAWEAVRIEAGIPAMGRELDARTIAAEVGLVERTVSFTKGCYTGQELVARLDARGSRVARRMVGIVAAPDAQVGPAELEGASLWIPGRDTPAGRCTSAAFCPGLGAVAGLASLHRSVDVPAALAWSPGGDDSAGPGDGGALVLEARTLPLVG